MCFILQLLLLYYMFHYPPRRHAHSLHVTMATDADDVTASILIIGDEILKGKITDANSAFLCKRLYRIGVKLSRVTVVPDNVDQIAEEVREASRRHSFVITAGGIGPTHDDVTYAAVAKAFDEKLIEHSELTGVMRDLFPLPEACTDLSNPAYKMAVVPESSQLHYLHKSCGQLDSPFPIISCRNVFIFPGVPQYLRRGFIHLEYLFWNPDRQFFSEDILIKRGEVSLIPILNRAVEVFSPDVAFGSYPQVCSDATSCTKLTMESFNHTKIDEAREFFRSSLPAGSVLELQDDELVEYAADRIVQIMSTADDSLPVCEKMIKMPLQEAVKVIERSFSSFHPTELCLAFNGGKDCSALLYLLLAVQRITNIHQGCGRRAAGPTDAPLKVLYIRCHSPFPEMERFIHETRRRFSLHLIMVDGPIKQGLTELKKLHPEIKAVWMGTRKGDPFTENMKHFQMTDPGWPRLLRVNPILDWKYNHIWSFLRELGLPYCSLYDRGYTSLGTLDNTRPNSILKYVDASGRERYKPAYLLDDSAAERQGRGGFCIPDCCGRPSQSIDLASMHPTAIIDAAGALHMNHAHGGVSDPVIGVTMPGAESVTNGEQERPLCGRASSHSHAITTKSSRGLGWN